MEQKTTYYRSKIDNRVYSFTAEGNLKPYGDMWEEATEEDFLRENVQYPIPIKVSEIDLLKQRVDTLEKQVAILVKKDVLDHK